MTKKNVESKDYLFLFKDSVKNGHYNSAMRFFNMSGKPDLNDFYIDGKTSLHHAVMTGNEDLVIFLMKHGADVNIPDNQYYTPLHSACQRGFFEIAKMLIKAGADIHYEDIKGDPPLAVACTFYPIAIGQQEDQFKIIRHLVRSGADTNHSSVQNALKNMRNTYNANGHLVNYLSESALLHCDKYIAKKPRVRSPISISDQRALMANLYIAKGNFSDLVKKMKGKGYGFEFSDFSIPISEKYSALDVLCQTGQIWPLLDFEVWNGRFSEFVKFKKALKPYALVYNAAQEVALDVQNKMIKDRKQNPVVIKRR